MWAEFLLPDTAEVVAWLDHPYRKYPAITRNRYGRGVLTYEGTMVTDALQREIVRDILKRAGLTGPGQGLPPAVKVRHGRNGQYHTVHYYFNFSGEEQRFQYPHGDGLELTANTRIGKGQQLRLKGWDVAIMAEQ